MKHRALFVLSLGLSAIMAAGQDTEKKKIDLHLGYFLQQAHAPGEEVNLFIHGPEQAVSEAVRAQGGIVKRSRPGLVAARMPVSAIAALASSPAVDRFEFRLDPGMLLCDSMRVKAHVNEVHAGLSPLPQAYDGENVVIGFIDDGLDVDHPDLRNDDNTSRVAFYWDQGLTGSGAPPEFGYGREWNNAQINAGQLGSTDGSGHGTTVTGCGAGDGSANGRHKGVAPRADIIVVKYSGAGDFRANVADAAQYIFERAAALGKPAVVNASLGTYSGSHDGYDAAALFINDMLDGSPGRMFVCAAGNYGQAPPFHLRLEAGTDTTFTWFATNSFAPPYNLFNFPNMFFELWADADEFNNVEFAIGADRTSPSYQFRGATGFHTIGPMLGGSMSEPLTGLSGNELGTVQYFAQTRGDQVQLQVLIADPDSAAYNWRFMVKGSGRCDIWSTALIGTSNIVSNELVPGTVPTPDIYPPIAAYIAPDHDKQIVDSWACSDHTLTVANYWNLVEYAPCSGPYVASGATPYMISAGSSAGPTRDERWKPDIAAPGDVTMACGPLPILADWATTNPDKLDAMCMHMRNGGTSMASPVVAGVAALYLEKCPSAGWQQVRNAVINTAWGDALTDVLPNKHFGYGRVHAFNALVSSNLPDITITGADDEVCSNATVELTAPAGYQNYLWSDGSTSNPTQWSGAGPATVVASDGIGCAHSNALTFSVLPVPAVPTITPNGSELTSSAGPSYQWYLNGSPILDANGQVWTALVSGSYAVEVTDVNGCSAMSLPEMVIVNAVAEAAVDGFALWPSLSTGKVNIRVPAGGSGPVRIRIFDAHGRAVVDRTDPYAATNELVLDGSIPSGVYSVVVEQGNQRWEARFVKQQ